MVVLAGAGRPVARVHVKGVVDLHQVPIAFICVLATDGGPAGIWSALWQSPELV